MTATQGHSEGARAKTLDRRQLLKAGAWATPVVVLAAASPAASASGTVAQLIFNYMDVRYLWDYSVSPNRFLGIGGSTSLLLSLVSGPAINVTSISLSLNILPSQGMLAQPAGATTVPAPDAFGVWTAGAGSVDEDTGTATYLFTWAGTMSTGQGTTKIEFVLPADNSPRPDIVAKTMDSLATAPGISSATRTDGVAFFTDDPPTP